MKYYISYNSAYECGLLDETGRVTDIDFAIIYDTQEEAQKQIDEYKEAGFYQNGSLSVYEEE